MKNIVSNPETFGDILICAIRYALGRKTYMPAVVADFTKLNVKKLTSKTLNVICNDIRSAESHGLLGDPAIDAPVWKGLLSDCLHELENRKTVGGVTIGERVRYARKEKGLSQLCLAMRCDMYYQSQISKIERNECVPTLKTINRLAKELGVSPDWLINGEGAV